MEKLSIGRYRLHEAIASGGMAVVHLGRLAGAAGFSRTVAIKRLHPHLAKDPELVRMLLDEARLASRVRHPNVAPIFDVVVERGEVCLVLEYVEGESLSQLLTKAQARGERVPLGIALAIVSGALRGLAAAHAATADDGTPLGLVHRDVSPQNILVGVDGIARVIDFGVAKATARLQTTQDGQLKGKFGYMAPEQLHLESVDARTDIYAAGIVLWEALAGRRLFDAPELAAVLARTTAVADPPSRHAPDLDPAVDQVVLRALSLDPGDRYPTAAAMVQALTAVGPIGSPDEVSAWVRRIGGEELLLRQARVAAVESGAAPDAVQAGTSEVATAVATVVPSPPKRRPIGVRAGALLIAAGVALVLAFASGTRFSRSGGQGASPASSTPASTAEEDRGADMPPSPAPTLLSSTSAAHGSATPPRRRGSATSVPHHGPASPKASGPPSYCSQRKLAFTTGPDGIERPRPECL
jgi:eukaryotic-like serine/threonine-protein kinase